MILLNIDNTDIHQGLVKRFVKSGVGTIFIYPKDKNNVTIENDIDLYLVKLEIDNNISSNIQTLTFNDFDELINLLVTIVDISKYERKVIILTKDDEFSEFEILFQSLHGN